MSSPERSKVWYLSGQLVTESAFLTLTFYEEGFNKLLRFRYLFTLRFLVVLNFTSLYLEVLPSGINRPWV